MPRSFDSMEEMNAFIQKQLKTNGWIMKGYADMGSVYSDFHTMGLKEKYKHLDLQIVYPMDQDSAYQIFSVLIDNICHGITYKENHIYSDILQHRLVKFRKYKHENGEVLRVIISDAEQRMPTDEGCSVDYKFQEDDFQYVCTIRVRRGDIIMYN